MPRRNSTRIIGDFGQRPRTCLMSAPGRAGGGAERSTGASTGVYEGLGSYRAVATVVGCNHKTGEAVFERGRRVAEPPRWRRRLKLTNLFLDIGGEVIPRPGLSRARGLSELESAPASVPSAEWLDNEPPSPGWPPLMRSRRRPSGPGWWRPESHGWLRPALQRRRRNPGGWPCS